MKIHKFDLKIRNKQEVFWVTPFIEIAEENDLLCEMVLAKALNFQEVTETIRRRVYE